MSEEAPQKLPKDLAAEQGMVNVQIDGTWYRFPIGTKIIEACRQVGTVVPHFCYHPKLSVRGSCRMCLVEQGMPPRLAPGQEPAYDEQGYQPIQWMPRAIIACANNVAENMGIRTKGTLVETVRRGVMEFLLINHPLDCPICDKAGECLLQEHAYDYGRGTSAFEEAKVKKPKNMPVGPRITLDAERCVMCGRCIRFMREVAKDPVLTFTDRGAHTTICCYPGRELDHPYSMNVTDICPVGALTTVDFRHKMRVWFLKQTSTIDTHDGTGINITVGSREGRIFRVKPRRNDAVNSDWMPDAYRLDYAQTQTDNRFTQPFALSPHGAQEAITWDRALDAVAEAFARFSASEIAVIASGRCTNEELFATRSIASLLSEGQAGRLDIVPRTGEADDMLISADKNPNTEGARLILGLETPGSRLTEIREGVRSGTIRALLVIGEDLTAPEAGFEQTDLDKLDYLTVIATQPNATTAKADIILPGVSSFEKYGTMINVTGRIQRLNQAICPPGNAREDYRILLDLLAHFRKDGADIASCVPTAIQFFNTSVAPETPALSSLTWDGIGEGGVPVIDSKVTIPLIERERSL